MTKTDDEIIKDFTKRLEYRNFSPKIIDDFRGLLKQALTLKQKQQDEKVKEFEEKVDEEIKRLKGFRPETEEEQEQRDERVGGFEKSKQLMRKIFVK